MVQEARKAQTTYPQAWEGGVRFNPAVKASTIKALGPLTGLIKRLYELSQSLLKKVFVEVLKKLKVKLSYSS